MYLQDEATTDPGKRGFFALPEIETDDRCVAGGLGGATMMTPDGTVCGICWLDLTNEPPTHREAARKIARASLVWGIAQLTTAAATFHRAVTLVRDR